MFLDVKQSLDYNFMPLWTTFDIHYEAGSCGSFLARFFFNISALIQEDLLELFRYKLAAELVLSKDNKQQRFKLFKALKNRAVGFFFFSLSNNNALYKCECESLSISKQEHCIHHLDNTQPSILSLDICSLY
ncbi:uncharacterized protein LOC126718712 [Quercus robur]|uniref:uncharacterized protein LOC126718712 n=1 Tax=Quercus robur TaxID=38942 RepID=UPI0021633698|nr:uncharacterized protein LOC126718712 [Quercus robur]